MTQSKSKSKPSAKPAAPVKKEAAPATAKKVKKPTTSAADVLVATSATVEKLEKKAAPKAEKKVEARPVEKKVETAPVTAPVAVVEKPARVVSHAEFTELVRKEAYLRAQRRDFQNGSPFEDWVHAEAAVSGLLAAQGARLA